MREIKYKAFDKINKKWINLYKINIHKDGGVMSITSLDGAMYGLHQVELVQYTGLKDKNGVEIYEGDIVNAYFNPDEVEGYIFLSLNNLQIRKGEKIFVVDSIHFGYEYPVPNDLEIIGNIYENQELLEGEK